MPQHIETGDKNARTNIHKKSRTFSNFACQRRWANLSIYRKKWQKLRHPCKHHCNYCFPFLSFSFNLCFFFLFIFLWYDLVMYKFRDAETTTTRSSIQKSIVSILFTHFFSMAIQYVRVHVCVRFFFQISKSKSSSRMPLFLFHCVFILRFGLLSQFVYGSFLLLLLLLYLSVSVCVFCLIFFILVPFRIRLCPCLSCVSPLIHVKQLLGCLCICVCVFRYFSKKWKDTKA